jgi:hypothetical protein
VKKYSDYNDAMERVQQHVQAEKMRSPPPSCSAPSLQR